ncbi:MAG: PAS domain S-box protein [Anaerolineae bacterium]|nr:PAS domain S-box protein [Anaerolineae bacterium]
MAGQVSTESDKRYQMLVESASDVIYTTDAYGYCNYVNAAVERLYGYRSADVIGKHFSDFVAEDWRDRVMAFYLDQFQRRVPETRLEFPAITNKGEIRWVEQVVTLNQEGDWVIGFNGFVREITQRKQAEDQLRESESRLRIIVENAPNMIYIKDVEGRYVLVNPAVLKLGNSLEKDFIGRTDAQIHNEHETTRIREIEQEILASQKMQAYESSYAFPDGQRYFSVLKFPFISSTGESLGVIGISQDITQYKRTEITNHEHINRLEIIKRVDEELTQSLSIDYVLKIALDAAVRLSHAEAGAIHLIEGDHMWVAQVIGDYPRSLIGSRIPMDVGIVGRVVREGQPEMISDVTLDPDYVPNVHETKAQITIPLISSDRLVGVLNVQTPEPGHFSQQMFEFLKVLSARIANALENARLYDTTQKQLDEMQKLYQQVSDLEQLKTQMIRVAAHDLRNPLGVISGCLQMLTPEMDPTLSDRARDYHRIIDQAVDRMDKITRDILTLERVESGRGFLDDLVDMGELVSGVWADFKNQAAEKALDYQLDVTPKMVRVHGERAMLHETVGNLISNAIKYTPEHGKVCINLKTEGDQAVFEVEDTGYGIPQENQANLFQPFYRVKTNETRTIKGTGLGLHLVKSIVEKHNGQMHFRSVYGKGSTFGFELPLARKTGTKSRKEKAVKVS